MHGPAASPRRRAALRPERSARRPLSVRPTSCLPPDCSPRVPSPRWAERRTGRRSPPCPQRRVRRGLRCRRRCRWGVATA
ncbi:hypothetical protein FXF65_30140 [Actinomadura syzygii]|uniref:Uncharacterized protein n=1 Tax=Actinomadura syzygii TaxID=1427538 RepID=A0A5D0U0J1_9ACTN|nr:hypothetical protein FXF65_30140 [Actinomadura syzygii]